jgi:hypothetical protein
MYSNMTRRKRKENKASSSASHKQDVSGYKRYKGDKRQEEPFWITNLKVGGALTILCVAVYGLYNMNSFIPSSSGGSGMINSEGVWSKYVDDGSGEIGMAGRDADANANEGDVSNEMDQEDSKPKEFPEFELGKASSYDVWGIKENHFPNDGKKTKYDKFLQQVDEARDTFASDWGGENSARKVLEMGLITFSPKDTNAASSSDIDIPHGIRYTARRIVDAYKSGKPFKISFAGAAAVAGRGNYHDESFPSVLSLVLTEPFRKLGIELEVRNSAIESIGSFPYGWCLKNFLGDDADVVSWDPEMTNRGDTMAAFEAYLRNAITMKHSPMLIIREYAYTEKRRELLQKYVDLGAISDPVVININAAVDAIKDLDESILPPGYKNWEEFGGPDGAPGKTRTNLSLKQHELIGEMLSMHFLAAAELAVAHLLKIVPRDSLDIGPASKPHFKHYLLPPPQSSDIENDVISKNTTIMFGSSVPADQHWYMNNVHCRTSFDPVIYGELNETITSGTDAESIGLLLPRGPMLYNKNWVMNYGPTAKTQANNLKQYDLGYTDRRKGYFGVHASGNLSMFLPYQLDDTIASYEQLKEKKPSDVYKNVIVCEVNERADCKLESDVAYVLAGESAEAKTVKANGVSYNGKKLCVSIKVPDEASWSSRTISEEKGGLLCKKSVQEETGMTLDISVQNELLFWRDGPCSISHVIWEQVRKID